jgi:hypothetical protein
MTQIGAAVVARRVIFQPIPLSMVIFTILSGCILAQSCRLKPEYPEDLPYWTCYRYNILNRRLPMYIYCSDSTFSYYYKGTLRYTFNNRSYSIQVPQSINIYNGISVSVVNKSLILIGSGEQLVLLTKNSSPTTTSISSDPRLLITDVVCDSENSNSVGWYIAVIPNYNSNRCLDVYYCANHKDGLTLRNIKRLTLDGTRFTGRLVSYGNKMYALAVDQIRPADFELKYIDINSTRVDRKYSVNCHVYSPEGPSNDEAFDDDYNMLAWSRLILPSYDYILVPSDTEQGRCIVGIGKCSIKYYLPNNMIFKATTIESLIKSVQESRK